MAYAQNPYDVDRFRRVLALSSELAEVGLPVTGPEVRRAYLENLAHVTPLLAAEAVVLRGGQVLLMRRGDNALLGAITLDNIRRGPAQSATIGYWIGQPFARQGYMREAIGALVSHAFTAMDLSRIEAACLPENVASRGVLEKSGFKYEGVAQSYLQIHGRWRNHVLYSILRGDRRGRTDAG